MAKKIQSEYISIDSERMGGTPVFKGTRVPITALFDCLRLSTIDEFIEGYPQVSREAINDVLNYAMLKITQKPRRIIHESVA
jgi:uncharacterized protein (DUF433 family)